MDYRYKTRSWAAIQGKLVQYSLSDDYYTRVVVIPLLNRKIASYSFFLGLIIMELEIAIDFMYIGAEICSNFDKK